MSGSWRRIKPGWYLLLALLLYSLITTVALQRSNAMVRELRAAAAEAAATLPTDATSEVPHGLWFPIPGARLPQDPAHLPNSARPYRRGVSQGFDFYGDDAGIPIVYGTPVIASEAGVLERVDTAYSDPDPEGWQALLEAVAENGADDAQLDRLRGRQIWLRTDDGRLLRYAHLSAVRQGLVAGGRVYHGQVIGFVGNSGTDDGVQGTQNGARLHFEIWQDGTFFGADMTPEEVQIAAASLFTGP